MIWFTDTSSLAFLSSFLTLIWFKVYKFELIWSLSQVRPQFGLLQNETEKGGGRIQQSVTATSCLWICKLHDMTGRITETVNVNEMNWISFHYCILLFEDAVVEFISLLKLICQTKRHWEVTAGVANQIVPCERTRQDQSCKVSPINSVRDLTCQEHVKFHLGFKRKKKK